MDMQSLRLCFLSCLFGFFFVGNLEAQIWQSGYLESEITDKTSDEYRLFLLGTKGLIIAQILPNEQRKREILLDCFDTAFQKKWSQHVPIPLSLNFISYYVGSSELFVFTLTEKNDYQVIRISVSDGSFVLNKFSDFKKFEINHFAAIDSFAILGGVLFEKSVLVLKNLESNKTFAPPILSKAEAELTHLVLDTLNRQIWTVLKGRQKQSKELLYFNRFNLAGELKSKLVIAKGRFYQPVQYRFLTTADTSLIVVGSYAHRGESLVQGLFFWKITGQKLEIEKYFDFAFFDNYFRYLSDKKRAKITLKAQKKRAKNKFYTIRQRLMLHEPILTPEGTILLVGESYQGIPRSSPSQPLQPYYYSRKIDFYTRAYIPPPSYTTPSLDYQRLVPPFLTKPDHGYERDNWGEFRYEHSMSTCFSQEGQKLWDNSFVFQKLTENQPVELSSVVQVADSLVMVYCDGTQVSMKVSLPKKYQDQTNTLPLLNENVIVDLHINGGMAFWYDKHLLHCGIREIRLKGQSIFKSKRYFYVSKLSILK